MALLTNWDALLTHWDALLTPRDSLLTNSGTPGDVLASLLAINGRKMGSRMVDFRHFPETRGFLKIALPLGKQACFEGRALPKTVRRALHNGDGASDAWELLPAPAWD